MNRTITVDEYIRTTYEVFMDYNIADKENEDMIVATIVDVIDATGIKMFGELEYSHALSEHAKKTVLPNIMRLAEEYANNND